MPAPKIVCPHCAAENQHIRKSPHWCARCLHRLDVPRELCDCLQCGPVAPPPVPASSQEPAGAAFRQHAHAVGRKIGVYKISFMVSEDGLNVFGYNVITGEDVQRYSLPADQFGALVREWVRFLSPQERVRLGEYLAGLM